jgi:hypothetical protein
MVQRSKTIHVEPGSELDRVLQEAGDAPIELEQRGVRYRVIRVGSAVESRPIALADQGDIWAGYDPERVRHGLRGSSGALRGVDRDQLGRDLAEQRAQDSHGRPN